MKIGFDAKRAVQNNTGLGNYSRYIVEILLKYFPENEYYLFAPKRRENKRLNNILSYKNISIIFPENISRYASSFWRSWNINKEIEDHKIDVFHGLSNELPFSIKKTKTKSIVTIHDLIFLRYPEYYKPLDRIIYNLKFKHACRMADKVIAISECTKRDIISFFHIPEEKIEVIYQGCDPAFSTTTSEERKEEVRKKHQLPNQYILYVGSIESRKNLLLIVKALKNVPENIHLVAIGKTTNYQKKVENYIQDNNLSSRIHIYNNITFTELPVFYQLASIFVFPSFFEGFGIPIIEALSSGTPVIAATGSCLEEAGGPGSLYVDPHNPAELANKINHVLNDTELSKRMILNGKEYIERFQDKIIANELMNIYQSLSLAH